MNCPNAQSPTTTHDCRNTADQVFNLDPTAIPTAIPTSSPWGPVQHHDVLAEGIVFVSTASHGGIKLAEPRIAEMPSAERKASGWYEVDCEAAFVLRHFADANVIPATDADRKGYRRICELFTSFERIRMPT